MLLQSQASPMSGNLVCAAESGVAAGLGDHDFADIEARLDAIEQWPDLGEIFFQRSLRFLARRGFSRWASAGGTVGVDGRPSFGIPSYLARRLITDITARAAGVRYRDSNGFSWAVKLIEDRPGRPGSLRGLALGCEFDARLLCRPYCKQCIGELAERMQQMAPPGKRLSESDWRNCDRLRDRQRRLIILGEAVALVPRLYTTATCLGKRHLQIEVDELAAVIWGPDRLPWPDDWKPAVFQALACLGQLQVEVLVIPKSGWAPRPTAREPALTGLSWWNRNTLSVNVGARFLEFLDYLIAVA